MLLADVQWDQFWVMVAPGFIAVLFSIATYIKSRAAAISSDRNSSHLSRQDEKLATIEYQMTDECIVRKAKEAGERILNAAKAEMSWQRNEALAQAAKLRNEAAMEAAKLLETAKQAAVLVHSEARKVTGESQRAADVLATAAAQIKQQASDSRPKQEPKGDP